MSEASDPGATMGWGPDVRFAPGPDWFAYRPGELLVGGEVGREATLRRFESQLDGDPERVPAESNPEAAVFYRFRGLVDPVAAVEVLRSEGVVAQPNHLLFAHGCGCCAPHPARRWQGCLPGHPMYASPMYASPMYASPMYASPMYASEMQAAGPRRNSAVPAIAPPLPSGARSTMARTVRVAVLDTGMAADGQRPAALDGMSFSQQHWEVPDVNGDLRLEPAAGHGTFIAGLIDLVAPGCEITVERVLSSDGVGDEAALVARLHALAGTVDLINLSFGGYSMERMHALAAAVAVAATKGTVVVASAGNDGSCRPVYPAALPGVVGVGAVGPGGPAPFSNYGPWVRACAPGVDIVSWFFADFDGVEVAAGGGSDPDRFRSWARWSGTSFAAPIVTAALARAMGTYDVSAAKAVERVIDNPALLRLPDLGTLVNVS
ncbi:MAG TPA: S8/S53 family peptidase [Acidimicrobiales bacterium]|nr:S8/S53 family peptidase [Acidimicrobiales bacterium]